MLFRSPSASITTTLVVRAVGRAADLIDADIASVTLPTDFTTSVVLALLVSTEGSVVAARPLPAPLLHTAGKSILKWGPSQLRHSRLAFLAGVQGILGRVFRCIYVGVLPAWDVRRRDLARSIHPNLVRSHVPIGGVPRPRPLRLLDATCEQEHHQHGGEPSHQPLQGSPGARQGHSGRMTGIVRKDYRAGNGRGQTNPWGVAGVVISRARPGTSTGLLTSRVGSCR